MTDQILLALASGALVSFVLGLVGGGGSMLALPLLVHAVGVGSPHVAVGVSAVAVSVNAFANLGAHARTGTVKWGCAALFTASGVVGAALGSLLGKSTDGEALLTLFGLLMIVVGGMMLRKPASAGRPEVQLTRESAPTLAPRLIGLGLLTGAASGFFGIGGGFLIAPALMWATDMPLAMAMGSSLLAVSAFGVTTAVSYIASGLIDWELAALFILGGFAGGLLGVRAARKLHGQTRLLRPMFAAVVVAVGVFVAVRGWQALAL